ncbi:MAG TPA: hypothetical protein VFD33_06645 [Bacillota bacterium]|nr:hypothetical protein [Bacillota bacterium]
MKRKIMALSIAMLFLFTSAMTLAPSQAEEPSMLISDCSTLDDWESIGGNALRAIENGWQTNSAIAKACNFGLYRGVTYTSPAAVDVSSYERLEWDMFYAPGVWDQIKEHYTDDIYVKIGSSDASTRTYKLDKISSAAYEGNEYWHHFSITLDDFSSEAGAFNTAEFESFSFTTTDGGQNDAVGHGDIRIDNIYVVGERLVEEDNDDDGDETLPELPVNKENPENAIWLSDADSLTGWSALGAQSDDVLVLDDSNMTEGTASVGAFAEGGVLRKIDYSPAQALDVSAYKYLEFDIYFSDMTWFDNCGGVLLELTSSGAGDLESNRYQKGALGPNFEEGAIEGKAGWYHVKLELDNPQSQANGGADLSQLDYFRFYSVNPIADTPDYTMRIDNILFTNEEYVREDNVNDIDDVEDDKNNDNDNGDDDNNGVEDDEDTADEAVGKATPKYAMWLSDADSLTGWSATGASGDNVLVLDEINKTEGSASLGAFAEGGVLKELVYIPEQALDVRDYKYLEFDIYFSDMTWFENLTGVMFEITSSGTCDLESNRYQKGALSPFFESNAIEGKPGWYHVKLELDNPQSQANGGADLSQLNYFRFYSVNPIADTPDYTMRIDNILFTTEDYVRASDDDSIPKTGDDFNIIAAMLLVIVSGLTLVKMKKRKFHQ